MADMTNYERIKNMTIHEIVDLISHNYRCRKGITIDYSKRNFKEIWCGIEV